MSNPKSVYLVVKHCDDPFYPPHPTKSCFLKRENAETACRQMNQTGDGWDLYSVKEIFLMENIDE